MSSPHRFRRRPIAVMLIGAIAVVLAANGSATASPGDPAEAPVGPERPSTPELIDRAVAAGEIDRSTGARYLAYAVGSPKRLPAAYRSPAPWRGTIPLLEVQRTLRTLPPTRTRLAIARVVGGAPRSSRNRGCSSSRSPLPDTRRTEHFLVEYDARALRGALSIRDYVRGLETAWATEVDSFGWAAPPDRGGPPGGRYHARIDDLPPGLYGYTSTFGTFAGKVGDNPNTSWDDRDAFASCLVLNDDFSGFPSGPAASMRATIAHEFNHAIQFGYGALTGLRLPDLALIEGGTTWIEDEVFDNANDSLNYLWPRFGLSMGEYTATPYPYWVVIRALLERFGAGTPGGSEQVMQEFWELASRREARGLDAMDKALRGAGVSLADAYHEASIALRFSMSCAGSLDHPFCLEEGPEYVRMAGLPPPHRTIAHVGGRASGKIPDNYALDWVRLPVTSRPFHVTLRNTDRRGALRASLVCRHADGVRIDPMPRIVRHAGRTSLRDVDSSGCHGFVAVITNQRRTGANPFRSPRRTYVLSTRPA